MDERDDKWQADPETYRTVMRLLAALQWCVTVLPEVTPHHVGTKQHVVTPVLHAGAEWMRQHEPARPLEPLVPLPDDPGTTVVTTTTTRQYPDGSVRLLSLQVQPQSALREVDLQSGAEHTSAVLLSLDDETPEQRAERTEQYRLAAEASRNRAAEDLRCTWDTLRPLWGGATQPANVTTLALHARERVLQLEQQRDEHAADLTLLRNGYESIREMLSPLLDQATQEAPVPRMVRYLVDRHDAVANALQGRMSAQAQLRTLLEPHVPRDHHTDEDVRDMSTHDMARHIVDRLLHEQKEQRVLRHLLQESRDQKAALHTRVEALQHEHQSLTLQHEHLVGVVKRACDALPADLQRGDPIDKAVERLCALYGDVENERDVLQYRAQQHRGAMMLVELALQQVQSTAVALSEQLSATTEALQQVPQRLP